MTDTRGADPVSAAPLSPAQSSAAEPAPTGAGEAAPSEVGRGSAGVAAAATATATATATGTAPAAAAATATPTVAPPPARRRGVAGTVADMARSLGVLLAVVVVVWLVSGTWRTSTHPQTGIAAWRSQVTDVAPSAAFAIEAPKTLPAGWAVSALQLSDSGTQTWTMTVTTASGHYLDLDQGVGSLSAQATAVIPDGVADGQLRLGADTWTGYRLPADSQRTARVGLGRQVGSTAVIVSGTGLPAELRTFAGSLQPTR